MPLENATNISELNASNPAHTDSLSAADSHMRLIKSVLKATFPNISGAVTATHTELNTAADGFPIETASISDSAVTTAKIADSNVTTAKIADAAVTPAKMSTVRAFQDALIPAGTIWEYAGPTAPDGWLFPYGQLVSRSAYPALFAAIGETHGAGNGATTFQLPDLRGRVVAGQDDMGGTSANRLTGQSGGVDGDVLGAVGGEETHVNTLDESAPHDHGGSTGSTAPELDRDATTNTALNGGSSWFQLNGQTGGDNPKVAPHTHTIASAGGGQPHNNVQPTIILNHIIKAH